MADSATLKYISVNQGNQYTSNLNEVNPSLSGSAIRTVGESFQDLVAGGNVPYAEYTQKTRIVVSADSD